MAFDPSGDYSIVDGNETVTYRPKPTGSDVTGITGAFREQRSHLEVGASTEPTLLGWWLPQPQMTAVTPKAGDQIIDAAGVVWVITAFEYHTLIRQYRFSTAQVRT